MTVAGPTDLLVDFPSNTQGAIDNILVCVHLSVLSCALVKHFARQIVNQNIPLLKLAVYVE